MSSYLVWCVLAANVSGGSGDCKVWMRPAATRARGAGILGRRMRVIGTIVVGLLLAVLALPSAAATRGGELWVLKPVVRPEVPVGVTSSGNPIDAFVAAEYRRRGLRPVGR